MKYSSSSFGTTDSGFSPRRFGRKAALLLGLAALLPASLLRAANNEADFNNYTDLTAAGDYSVSGGTFNPASGSGYDVVLGLGNYGGTNAYSSTAFTANTSLVFGSLNDLSSQTLTITNASGTNDTITLGTTTNAVAPSGSLGGNASDYLYVANGANLSIGATSNVAGTLIGVTESVSGNIDVAGNGQLTLNNGLTINALNVTKTGTGTLTLGAIGASYALTSTSSNNFFNMTNGKLIINGNFAHSILNITGGTIDTGISTGVTVSGEQHVDVGGSSANTATTAFTFGNTYAMTFGGANTPAVDLFSQGVTINLAGANNNSNTTLNSVENAYTSTTTGTGSGAQTLEVDNASGTTGATLKIGAFTLSAANGNTSNVNEVIQGNANIAISGAVTAGSAAGTRGITYAGTGTLGLAGASTYNGGTLVQSGTVSVTGGSLGTGTGTGTTGDGTSGTGTGTVTVGNGTTTTAAYLTGTGYISGNVTTISTGGASSNIAHIAPGTLGTVGTLHLGIYGGSSGSYALGTPSLSLGNGSALDFDLSSAATTAGGTTNDLISMSGGTLTLGSGLILNISASTVNAPLLGTATGGVPSSNYYVLISGFTGGTVGAVSNFTTVTGDGTDVANFYNTGTALEVYFTAGVVTSGNLYFSGNTNNDLTTASAYETSATGGTNGAAPTATTNLYFSANDNTNTSAILSSALTVNSLNFGAGSGPGNTNITVSATGSGAVTIDATNANSNTAGNGINVASGSDTISAPIVLGGSQTFTTASGSKLTISGPISQNTASQLTFAGSGTTVLTHDNTWGGGTAITGGTVYANNGGGATYTAPSTPHTPTGLGTGSALGSGAVNISSGAKLAGSGTVAGAVTVSGTLASGDATKQSAASPYTVTGTGLTLNSGVTVNAGATLQFTLGAGTASSLANPNTDSTYMSLTTNNPGEFNFASSGPQITFNLVDLTPNNATTALNLSTSNPYLLVQTGANSNFNLWTTGGYDVNGLVIGVGTSAGIVESASSAFAYTVNDINGNPETYYSNGGGRVGLYLYNGDLEVIPEPSTWALMIGGLGLLVLLQRRRKFSHWGSSRS